MPVQDRGRRAPGVPRAVKLKPPIAIADRADTDARLRALAAQLAELRAQVDTAQGAPPPEQRMLQPWQIALIRSAGQAGLAGLAAAGTALATGVDLRAGVALVIAAVVSALGWRAGIEGRIDQSAATRAAGRSA